MKGLRQLKERKPTSAETARREISKRGVRKIEGSLLIIE